MNYERRNRPPKLAEIFLSFVVPEDEHMEKLGDFEEGFHFKSGKANFLLAWFWYWLQLIKVIPVFLKNSTIWSSIMLRNYVKIAVRNLLRHKGYSFINISGLAIGMACCILIMLWVQDEVTYDRFHENSDRLYRTVLNVEGNWWQSSPWALKSVLHDEVPELEKSTRIAWRDVPVKYHDNLFSQEAALVDHEFLEMFTFPLKSGNPETALQSLQSAVVTQDFANRFFDGEDPMGRVFTANNQWELTVTGVLEKIPANSTISFDFLAPVRLVGEERLSRWWVESQTYVMLGQNADVDEIRSKMAGVVDKYDKRTAEKKILDIQAFDSMHLYRLEGTDPVIFVYIFATLAFFILLIACINFMNLSTARSGQRAREIGMRKVVGASRVNIVRQFYGESVLSALLSLMIAAVLVYLMLPEFNRVSGKQFDAGILFEPLTLAGILLITLITGLAAGSYPAMLLSSFKPVQILKTSFKPSSRGITLRKVLVVGQFTATVALIICTIVMYQQLNFIRSYDLGFDKEHILVIEMDGSLRKNYSMLKPEFLQHTGIMSVSSATNIPNRIGNINPVYWEGKTEADYMTVNFVAVDFDYFETFGMEMAHGRPFSSQFETDSSQYVINEALLKVTGLQDPVGKMFSMWNNEATLIGVVKDFHNHSLHSEISPTLFTMATWFTKRYLFIKLAPGSIRETMDFVEQKIKDAAPGFPFEYSFLDDVFEQQYRGDRQVGSLFQYFTILAIIISCLGLFGMASFMAQRRTREVGIRKVMGATEPQIMMIISREFLLLIAIANLIAWPAAYVTMNMFLENYAYRTGIEIWAFVVSAVLAVALTIISVSFQAIKAARTNPANSLRHE